MLKNQDTLKPDLLEDKIIDYLTVKLKNNSVQEEF
jgi:hypothetical protein